MQVYASILTVSAFPPFVACAGSRRVQCRARPGACIQARRPLRASSYKLPRCCTCSRHCDTQRTRGSVDSSSSCSKAGHRHYYALHKRWSTANHIRSCLASAAASPHLRLGSFRSARSSMSMTCRCMADPSWIVRVRVQVHIASCERFYRLSSGSLSNAKLLSIGLSMSLWRALGGLK